MPRLAPLFALVVLTACSNTRVVTPLPTKDAVTHPDTAGDTTVTLRTRLYGITLDAVEPHAAIVQSLSALPVKPWVRVVLDEFAKPSDYVAPLDALAAAGIPVMAELLDSQFVKDCDVACYTQRAESFYAALGNRVAVWEIGNEINGEWLGTGAGDKVGAAYDVLAAKGATMALTTYWCPSISKAGPMLPWLQANIPERVRTGVAYVFISVYEADCSQPNIPAATWNTAFDALGALFPNAKLGFGEVGIGAKDGKELGTDAEKAAYLTRYYTMAVTHPRYVIGGFWWFGRQDMVPAGTPVWQALAAVMGAGG